MVGSHRKWFIGTLLALGVFAIQLISLLRAGNGLIGHDYVWFMPRFIEGLLFFRAQGLSAPLYSSLLCGGFPYHADPQVMFYSLPQLLTLVIDPWSSTQTTAAVFLFIGGVSAYACGRSIFRFTPPICFVIAVAYSANGFFRSRFLIGHLTYQAFPLTALVFLGLFHRGMSRLTAVLILSGCFTCVVHSGGNYTAPILAASIGLCVPLLRMRAEVDYGETLLRGALGFVLAVCLSASKLAAGFAYAGNHPRIASFNHADTLAEAARLIFSQLFAPWNFNPFSLGPWEYDSSIAPLLPIGWILACIALLRARKRAELASGGAFLILFGAVLQLSTGYGDWVDSLKELPILDQMRVNVRFTSIVILPLVLLAAIGFESLGRGAAVALVVGLSALVPGELLRPHALSYMDIPLSQVDELWRRARAGSLSVDEVTIAADDLSPLLAGMTNKRCYSVFFARPPTRELEEGRPIREIIGGKFNLVKPACYVYPHENNCSAGDRIPAEERPEMESLLAHVNPRWNVSKGQQFADGLTLLSVAAFVLLCVVAIFTSHRAKKLSRRSAPDESA